MSAETLKTVSQHLRGTIAAELDGPATAFGADAASLLKFHGIYQQDDRDTRRERTRAGEELDHSLMVRVAIPGGRLSGAQWLDLDGLAGDVGADSLRLTTRQGIQFHGVAKGDVAHLLRGVVATRLSTFAACGDVVRNVMASTAPLPGPVPAQLDRWAGQIAAHFRPATTAYAEIFIDGERAAGVEPDETVEPIYGDAYLPRKFKMALASPSDNGVDVLTDDVGIVPIVVGDEITAFTISVGGGLGRSQTRDDTYPRLGSWFADVAPGELLEVLEAIVGVQRDHGEREDRQKARLKYLIDRWGLDRFRAEVQRRLGRLLAPATAHVFRSADDHLGWHQSADGTWFCGVHVPSGRVRDAGERRYRSAVAALVGELDLEVRCTPQQNLLLCGVADGRRDHVEEVLAAHGVPLVDRLSPRQRRAMACPALPTCGQALGEAERIVESIVDDLDAALVALGLGDDELEVRMTGCPNGCARPYVAELGLVGRTKTAYDVYIGGAADGTRLSSELIRSVKRTDIVPTLVPLLARWGDERLDDERFGDFAHRIGVEALAAQLAPLP